MAPIALLVTLALGLSRSTSGERAEAIATDFVHAVEAEKDDLPFEGDESEHATALLLLAIAWQESGLAHDVETCKRSGDRGLSIGLFQIIEGPNREGIEKETICSDREVQAKLALHVLGRARKTCGASLSRVLGSYNGGECAITGTSRRTASTFEVFAHKAGIRIHRDGARLIATKE